MALPKFYKVCQDQQGNIVPQVLGSVFNHGTAVLASLYQDDAGTLPLANPMTSDAQYGSFKFYVNPGHYDLTFTKPGYTFEPIDDLQVPADIVTLGTMAQQNANAVAITGGTLVLPYAQLTTGIRLGDSTPPGVQLDVVGNGRVTGTLSAATGILAGGIGAPQGNTRVHVLYQKSTKVGILMAPTDNDTGPLGAIVFANLAGGVVGEIVTTATATAYNTTSDVRLKHAIAPLAGALDVLAALRPVRFRWNADDSQDEGFLAHELQQVLPRAVTGTPDAVDAEGRVRPQGVDHAKLVPWLVGAVQDLAGQVQALTARVAELETLIAS